MVILLKKFEYENMVLFRDVIEYIVIRYFLNIWELEGVLIRVVIYIFIFGLFMIVENIVFILNLKIEKLEVLLEVVIKVVFENFNLFIEDLKGSFRK